MRSAAMFVYKWRHFRLRPLTPPPSLFAGKRRGCPNRTILQWAKPRAVGTEPFHTHRHGEVNSRLRTRLKTSRRRRTKLDEEGKQQLWIQKEVGGRRRVIVRYLESGCCSDSGRSGVIRPLASAADQGDGTEAWCSREGGGNGGGVARSLAAWTLRTAT
jgi:hypothetical protein